VLIGNRPKLSVVVIAFEMQREIQRTLYTLSPGYQSDVTGKEYEVLVVDNGSSMPLNEEQIKRFGPMFRLVRPPEIRQSPAFALNFAARQSRGSIVASMIDGARMLSPGCIAGTFRALEAYPNAIVTVPSWHVGPTNQNISVSNGYNQFVEDTLLESVDWKSDGYRLFDVSLGLDPSCEGAAWFKPIGESNFIAESRSVFNAVGGFSESFSSPGGGVVNGDHFCRVCEVPKTIVVSLLGEGTFHQFHGGVSTNTTVAEHPWPQIHEEYIRIRKEPYRKPEYIPLLIGPFNARVREIVARYPGIIA
jgi:glycosyltransferase involved in cell wall biosynthesis